MARAGVSHIVGASPQDMDLVDKVAGYVEDFELNIGQEFRDRNNKFYRQYRGFRKFADDWTKAGPNDRDAVVYDAKKQWGAHLHIPMSFRTIETMVPRAIANQPKMLVFPRAPEDQLNLQAVRLLLNAQQQNIDIDLPFQAIMRSGRIYGLGAGKSGWLREFALRRPVRRKMLRPGEYYVGDRQQVTTFDDPMFWDIDVYDLGWDPYGSDVRTCEWMYHRSWLSMKQCLARLNSGAWNTDSAKLLDEEKLSQLAGGEIGKYDEVWADRLEASGFAQIGRGGIRGEHPHELIEFHDGENVYSMLDRQVLVQNAENPCLGHLPFAVYRPTPLQKQMVGIGDLEPIEHLNAELDTLRSQRRDAATLALCAGFAYDDGMVDVDDLQFGPRAAIRVTNGRPSDALMPLQVRDVPGSGYQEELVIKQDMDVVTGVADETPGQVTTATESMLVQSSLSLRIQLSSRRFEIEVARNAAKQFLYLNQRMIVAPRQPIRVPEDGMDALEAAQAGRWQWFNVGPEQLAGEYHIEPEGGSMAQRNIQQDRQDAQAFMGLAGNPELDARKCMLKGLQLLGVDNPESYLKQNDPPIPPLAFEILGQMGVDPTMIQTAIQAAQQQNPQLPPGDNTGGGTTTAEVAQLMGGAR